MICGIPSEAKFDIFNDRNERILQALESNSIFIVDIIYKKCAFYIFEKLQHFVNVYAVQPDDVLHYVLSIISIR